jgi:hypothetical protein
MRESLPALLPSKALLPLLAQPLFNKNIYPIAEEELKKSRFLFNEFFVKLIANFRGVLWELGLLLIMLVVYLFIVQF